MSVTNQVKSVVNVTIQFIPNNLNLPCTINENKSFCDLSVELYKKYHINKEKWNFIMNDQIMNDDIILKDNGVKNNTCIKALRNDYAKFNVEVEDSEGKIQRIERDIFLLDYKIIKANENKEIKV